MFTIVKLNVLMNYYIYMDNSLKKKLGLNIKRLRLNAGYSQEVLAEKLDIAVNTLSNIERGNSFMTAATIEKIVNIFGISYAELFYFNEAKSKKELYKSITNRLNLIKDNEDKLQILDVIMKSLV